MSHRDKTLVEKPNGIQLNPVRDDTNGGLTSCIKSHALSDLTNHIELECKIKSFCIRSL